MNRSGLAMFSPEWMEENATRVPRQFHAMIASICEAYQLGEAHDPNTIWRLIVDGLGDRLRMEEDK